MAFSHSGEQTGPVKPEGISMEEELSMALPLLALQGEQGANIELENGRELQVRVCLKPAFSWEPLPSPPELLPTDLHVCSILLEQPMRLAENWELLGPAERRRATRFRAERDQQHYICAHASLRRILGAYLQRPPESLEFVSGEGGKPRLADENLRFNLSHSGLVALLAVTNAGEVGVDIEKVRPIQERDLVAKCFFAPGELHRYNSLAEETREAGFFNCWTRKEAYLKARGDGIANGLKHFEVSLDPDADAVLLDVQGAPDEAAHWAFYHLAPCPGYVAAAAIRAPDARLRVWRPQE